MCRAADAVYSIRCSYLEGSNAQGCMYILSSGSRNITTGFIERSSTEGAQVHLSDAEGVSEIAVSAVDWEADNSTGSIFIQGVMDPNGNCFYRGT